MAKIKTLFDKRGQIPGEITWKEIKEDRLESCLGTSLNFYNAVATKRDIKNDLFVYLKTNKVIPIKHQRLVKRNFDSIPFTTYKLARMLNLGFPIDTDTGKRMKKSIKEEIRVALTEEIMPETEDKPETKRISPLERIEANVGESILAQLEDMLDEWAAKSNEPGQPLDLANIVRCTGIPLQGYRFIQAWLDLNLNEFQAGLTGDEYDRESYSHLKKGVLRSWIKSIRAMKVDLEKLEAKQKDVKKKERKVRVKKPKNQFEVRKMIRKKVDRIKYLEEFNELSLKSISPEKIIGSNHLFIYNTKYGKFGYITAMSRDGLDLKGMAVTNFNDKLSYYIKVRKPEEFFAKFDDKNTLRKIENEVSKLTTKKSANNGRLNEHILILKVFA